MNLRSRDDLLTDFCGMVRRRVWLTDLVIVLCFNSMDCSSAVGLRRQERQPEQSVGGGASEPEQYSRKRSRVNRVNGTLRTAATQAERTRVPTLDCASRISQFLVSSLQRELEKESPSSPSKANQTRATSVRLRCTISV
jgi:hypothetical protein